VGLTVGACERSAEHGGTPPAPLAPNLAVERPEHDFGARREGERLLHRFAVRNTGQRRLTIARVEGGYSCQARPRSLELAPGAGADLEVACDTVARGERLRERLRLHSNDPARPVVTVEVRATLEPALAFDTALVELAPAAGTTAVQAARLRGFRAHEATLTVVGVEGPEVAASVLPAAPGVPAGVAVECRGDRVGTHVGRVRVATSLATPAELSLGTTCRVAGNLTVTPTNPFLDLRGPPPHERVITVTSRRPDFVLRGATVVEGPFAAAFAPAPTGSGWEVRVRIDDAAVQPLSRAVSGRLRLSSNDALEPEKEIPLFALGSRAAVTGPGSLARPPRPDAQRR
jgi:hypothetical protein